jgi:hypothetical protein
MSYYKVTVTFRDDPVQFKLGHPLAHNQPPAVEVVKVMYEGGFVVIRDDTDDQVAFPESRVKQVLVQRIR